MTEVLGPEVLPGRFSSLLIRGAWEAADADRRLAVSCGMAQAFKIPTEAYSGSSRCPVFGASQRRAVFLDRRSRPVPPADRSWGYGPPPRSPPACKRPTAAA